MSAPSEAKVVFGFAPQGDGAVLLLGLPAAGWEYIKDGKTHTLDLSSIGVPIKLILFGAKDRAEAIGVIEEHNKRQGLSSLHVRDRDFGIKG